MNADEWYAANYELRRDKPAQIEPCCKCGSREPRGRVWDCEDRPKVFCASCWMDRVAWLKAQKVSA